MNKTITMVNGAKKPSMVGQITYFPLADLSYDLVSSFQGLTKKLQKVS